MEYDVEPVPALPVRNHYEFVRRTGAQRKKILFLSTGGTIVSHPNKDGNLEPHPEPLYLFKKETKAHELADLDFQLIENIDSTNATPDLWLAITRAILEQQDRYDGIVVTHGTDTMQHSAEATDLMMRGRNRVPVVFTGSNLPLLMPGNDARDNVEDAVLTAVTARNKRINEVGIVFSRLWMRGNRTRKKDEKGLIEVFDSPAYPVLGTRSTEGMSLNPAATAFTYNNPYTLNPLDTAHMNVITKIEKYGLRKAHTEIEQWETPLFEPMRRFLTAAFEPITITDGFSNKLMIADIQLGDDMMRYLKNFQDGVVEALLIRSFGAGNIPGYILPFVRELRDLGVVVATTAREPGMGMNQDYDVAIQAEKAGVLQLGNMLESTAQVKMRMLMNRPDLNYRTLRKQMLTPFRGEIG